MTEQNQFRPNTSTTVRAGMLRAACRTLSAVAPVAAVPLAARLFRTPLRQRQPAREHRWAAGARRTLLPTRSGPVTAWSWGSGPGTVLLVHGWAGRGLQLGAFAAPLVARGLRVVTYDAPAHGEVAGGRSSLPELTGVAADVARRVGPLLAVVAHSLGASASLWAAAKGDLEAERFVALGPPSDFNALTDRFAAATGFSPRVVTHLRRHFEQELAFRWDDLKPASLTASLNRPLLVVHDRDDREVPWTEGRALAAAAHAARLLVTTGLGHRRLLGDAEVIAAVTEFVATEPVLTTSGLDARAPCGKPVITHTAPATATVA